MSQSGECLCGNVRRLPLQELPKAKRVGLFN